tara:strand:- start:16 stop:1329 length:1314 start_codon:yes stop_codon:yes gene_type:complete
VSFTTFTVTVSNPGSGNKYYIDGALQATVPLAYGATYRFDQSDSSNANHPLRFSLTSDGTHNSGSEYTTGVTYVGTPGQAGAYTQFVVTEVGPPATMYYYCSNHPGMGGAANLTANSWGGLSWGSGPWSDQGQIDLSATGQSLTSSIGSLQSVTADANVSPSGIQLTSSQGTSAGGTSALVQVTGNLESLGVGQVVSGIGALTTGIQASFSIGQIAIDGDLLTGEGWGRGEWGEFAWGDNFSVQVTGQSLTSSIGDETAFTDGTVPVTGSQIDSTFGNFSIISDVGITVFASEDQLDFTIGTLSFDADANVTVSGVSMTSSIGVTVGGLKTPVDVTGIQGTLSQGNISLEQTTIEPVTGISATISLGTHAEIPGQIIGISGLSITSALGEEGPITGNATVIPTGLQLTGSIGTPNITAWSEIDLGVSNTWTVVDLAA